VKAFAKVKAGGNYQSGCCVDDVNELRIKEISSADRCSSFTNSPMHRRKSCADDVGDVLINISVNDFCAFVFTHDTEKNELVAHYATGLGEPL
jgi:hypothetical protein